MKLSIRLAEPGDAETIAAFNIDMARETEGRALDPARIRSGVEALLKDAVKGVYYVAVHEGRVVGQLMITYEWSDWRNGNFWWIQSVYVEREFRGRHVFSSLFRHVETLARQNPEVCGLRLYVERDNTRAHKAYASLGMKPTPYEMLEMDFVLDA